jgi:hypothetical protein
MGQGTQIAPDNKHHIPASAPVSACGPAFGHVFFPAEGHAAVPACAGGYFDYRFIGEFFHTLKVTEN